MGRHKELIAISLYMYRAYDHVENIDRSLSPEVACNFGLTASHMFYNEGSRRRAFRSLLSSGLIYKHELTLCNWNIGVAPGESDKRPLSRRAYRTSLLVHTPQVACCWRRAVCNIAGEHGGVD